MPVRESLAMRWQMFGACLDERQRRLWAGVEASALGRGGVSAVSRVTGMSRLRVQKGVEELLEAGGMVPPDLFTNDSGQRRQGAGRKPVALDWPSLDRD